MATLFISDVHLEDKQPAITNTFLNLLETQGKSADAVYILGDLFEFWVGDDDTNPFVLKIMHALKSLSQQTSVYVMAGNRDFLYGKRFMQLSGCQLIPDPYCINLYNQSTLLMHGDTLCTLDIDYQKYRKKARHPLTKRLFLALPLSLRKRIVSSIRNASSKHTSSSNEIVMDACQDEVIRVMKKHQVNHLIHGHTHKPAIHLFNIAEEHNNTSAEMASRIVLSDWHKAGNMLLAQDDLSYELINIPHSL